MKNCPRIIFKFPCLKNYPRNYFQMPMFARGLLPLNKSKFSIELALVK